MATPREKTKPKAKETQEDLDKSPSRRAKPTADDAAEVAAHKAAKEEAEKAPKKPRKPAIQDDVTDFLSDIKSNDDAIRKVKKSEYFATINKKAWEKLLEAKDAVSGGLFRMRLGNMLRGAKSNAAKAEAKVKAKAEKPAKTKEKVAA